ncbi:MAG: hypothetical protein JKY02_07600 [Flavobacteriaceae bacterium]|nr:hypothetical protein [Flavobacteriaceae bacterium]
MKKIMLLVTLFCVAGLSYGQDLPEVIPPTPTVANLMQFEEVPISHYSGQANISIPIYFKAINADLGINIGLSYNTQSIKINNRSGWTGTGWSLNAGGVISRTVRGVPDELKRNTGLVKGEGVLHNDDYWNYSNLTTTKKQEFLWRANGTPNDKYDYQPDLFQFSFLGISGRFILKKENGLVVAKLLSKNQNIRVDIDYNTNASSNDYLGLNSFTITDTKGYIYTFVVKEVVQSEPFIAVETFDSEQNITGQGQDYVSTNAWHLSKIEMPNSTIGTPLVLATFEYQNSTESYTASVTRTESRPTNNYSVATWNDLMAVGYNASIVKARKSFAYLTTTSVTKKLSKITFTRDGAYIQFDLGSITHPETNGGVLEYIRIKDAGNVENKHFKFVYDANLSNRLWLNEVEEVAGAINQKYVLDYNDKHALPAFDSVHDGWGYNEGFLNPNSNCGISLPDPAAIQKGLLSKITYPTGGVKEFTFERHQITYQGNTQLTDNQYRDLNPDNWIPQTFNMSFNSATDNSAQSNILPETFIISQTQTLMYKKTSTTATPEEQFNAWIEITGPNNYRNVFRLEEDEVAFTLDAGTYEVRFFTLTIGTNYNYVGCIGYKNFESTVQRFVYGGGVRIMSIGFRDGASSPKLSKEISFAYNDAAGQNRSSGAIDGLITGLRRTHTETVTRNFILSACALPGETSTHSFDFQVTVDGINAELTQGQYVGYKTVDVSQFNNGYTRHTFTSAQDHYSPAAAFTYPYAPADDIDYKRGLLTKQEVVDNTNRTLKETTNSYLFEEENLAKMYQHYSEDCAWVQYYQFYNSYKNASNNIGTADVPMEQCYLSGVEEFDLITQIQLAWPLPNKKREIVNVTHQIIRNSSSLPCDNDCFSNNYTTCNTSNPDQVPYYFMSSNVKATWAKLVETQSKDYFYVGNSTNAQGIKESRQTFLYNTLNYQVSQQDSYYEVKGVEEHVQTKYFYPVGVSLNSNSGTIRAQLVTINKVNEILESQSFKNSVKMSETHTIYDDFDTNLLLPKEVHVGKGTSTPELRVEFASYDVYGNFLEGKKTGGTSVSYIYGFNRSMPVAKIQNATYSPIESILGSNFNLTGNLSVAQVNSLRSGLPNAMITIIVYNPIVGMTSITDPREETIYYEYDAMNRLEFVKDAYGKI